MDEDTLNMETRWFLKEFGVTTQRELEMAVRGAVETDDLPADKLLGV